MELNELENAIKKTMFYLEGKIIIISEDGERTVRENIKNFSVYSHGFFSSRSGDYLEIIFMDDSKEEIYIRRGMSINGIEFN